MKCAICEKPINIDKDCLDITIHVKDREFYVDFCPACISYMWWSLDKESRLRKQDTDLKN